MTDDSDEWIALPHDQALALVRKLLSPARGQVRVEIRGGRAGAVALAYQLGRLMADLVLDGELPL